jgi:hypothetical protein
MNTRKLQAALFAAATLVAGSAFADGAEYEYPQPITSSVSRAEVRAQVTAPKAVVAQDEYARNQYAQSELSPSTLQRVQVVAEAREARRLGLIAEGDSPIPVPTAGQSEQIRMAGIAAVNERVAAAKGATQQR